MEELIVSQPIYQGKVITVTKATVRLPDHTTAYRELVHTTGSAGVLALSGDRALFVSQWRTPLGQATLEVPAGRIESGEAPLTAAKRELNEEAGLASSDWQAAGAFYQAAGFSDAKCHLFVANNVHPLAHKRPQDVGEAVTAQWLTQAEAQAQRAAGLICDAKSVIALLTWAQLMPAQTDPERR